MRFATYQGEQHLADLVGRLFQFTVAHAGTLAQQAEAALLQANPQLRSLATLPAGTLIMVPEVPGVEPTNEVQPVGEPISGLVAHIRLALGDVTKTLHDAYAQQEKEASSALRLVESEEVQAIFKNNPEMQQRLSSIDKGTADRLKEMQALSGLVQQILVQADKDLADLARR